MRPFYHFFNIPVSTVTINDLIDQIAIDDDFVSWKLDIDNSGYELPIVINMLEGKRNLDIIDEFFFELHFRCVLMKKYWKDPWPTYDNYTNDRLFSFELFSDYRKRGVRAHFWP